MTNYNIFAKFYDAVMGNREKTAKRLSDFIRTAHPKAKSVLELACGTGAVLKYLAKNYKVSGLDLSEGMLAIAKKEVPQAKLYHQSMVDFSVPEKFDAILCVFDSINHLVKFDDWKKLFGSAQKHLNDGGIFIFDINTEKKLNRVISEPAGTREFEKNLMVMNVTDIGKGVSNWNVKIFEHISDDKYRLHEEDIKEVSFPNEKILKTLKPLFRSVKLIDTDKTHPKKKGERFYFICKK